MLEGPGTDCIIQRHGDELHFIVETEAIAIRLMPDPPGIWTRRKNHIICILGKKKSSEQQGAVH